MLPLEDLGKLFLHTEISWRLFNNNKEDYLGNKMWKTQRPKILGK